MKKNLFILTIVCATFFARGENIILKKVSGDVQVRHGVTEVWTKIAVGDVLKPDDTMKIGQKGLAVLDVNSGKRITLPAEVIVDVSDIRDLSQEELMLKLTMEKVRASSYQWKSNEMKISDQKIMHGPDRTPREPLTDNQLEIGRFEWNGTKVLYDNGYFSTSALKAIDILRRYPPLGEKFDNRLFIAQALEKANLRGEALSEYVALSQSKELSGEQMDMVKARVNQLRKQAGR